MDLEVSDQNQAVRPARTLSQGVPRLSRFAMVRERPLTALDEAAAEPVCVIHAPAGYGKTTLLAHWAEHRSGETDPRALLWVTIDSSCNARMTFWRHVCDQLAELATSWGIAFTPVDAGSDISGSLLPLVQRSIEQLGVPVILVIDAWEDIADPSIPEDLLRIVRELRSFSIVVATRSIDTEWLAEAAPYGLSVVTREDLEFTVQEYQKLSQHVNVRLDPAEIRSAVADTSGWAFALRIILEKSRDHLHSELTGSETLTALRARLTDEIVRMPGSDYLLATSVVSSFTTELAEWLGADPNDSLILDVVESRGLGSWEASTSPVFRLQPVLREGLLARLNRDAARRGFRSLSSWYERRGLLTRAFFSALDAEDAERAVSLAQRAFVPITVALNRSPEALTSQRRAFFAREPLLSLLNGISHNIAGNTGRAVQRFMTTIAVSEAQLIGHYKHPSPDHVWIQAALTAGLRLVGRYELVEHAYRRFRRMLDRVNDPEGVLDTAENLFMSESAITLIYLGRLDEAHDLVQAVRVPEAGRAERAHFYPACLSALTDAARGHISRAESQTRNLELSGLPRQFDPSFYAVPLHLARALVHLEHNRFEDAAELLDFCMLHWKTIEMWPLLLAVEVRIVWQKHGPGTALTVFEERKSEKQKHPPISPQMTAVLDELKGKLLVATGDLGGAHALVPARRYRSHPRLAVVRVLAFLVGGQPDRALEVAHSAIDARNLTLTSRVELGLLSASAHLRRGDRDRAARQFAESAQSALAAGLRAPFMLIPQGDLDKMLAGYERTREVREIRASLSEFFPSASDPAMLTERERVVLGHLDSGATLTEIAATLNVSINTVKSQSRSVYRKIGATDRHSAVEEARRRGIL